MRTICNKCMRRILTLKSEGIKRSVSKWSPLASVFNNVQHSNFDVKKFKGSSGLLLIPELQSSTGFKVLEENVITEVNSLVGEATDPGRKRKVVQIFDDLSDTLCKVADMADMVRVLHPDPKYNTAAEDVVIKLSGVVEQLNTNLPAYEALKQAMLLGDVVTLDDVDKRVGELLIMDFEQSGVHLDSDKKDLFVKLNESCVMLGNLFVQGAQTPVAVLKEILPEHIRHSFNIDGDNVLVTGLFQDHWNDFVREAAYRIYLHPIQEQTDLLEKLLSSRHLLADLTGFPTFAHRALRGTLAESVENVMEFLDTLSEKLHSRVERDLTVISNFKKSFGNKGSKEVMPWDTSFYSALARQKKYSVETQDLLPYFSLGCCMEGLSTVFRSLFDVTLQPVDLEPGETWAHDVYKLAVVHSQEGVLGYIYCDFYERQGKPDQDCHFLIRGGRESADGNYQLPVVVLKLTLPRPQAYMPALLTPDMVENLFHEFGHAMHSMLGRTKYQHVTGTRCSTDFAEIPSILMEYFASDPRVISSFARHYKTGEPLPVSHIEALCNSKKMFAALETQLQVFYAVLNQKFHAKHPLGKPLQDILSETQNQYYGIPHVKGTSWHLRFSHLVGYGAKYYSYLMSRAVAASIWQKYFMDDPFNRTNGETYRREFLAHGGGRHPKLLIEGMLKETPTMGRLVNSLIEEIDQAQQHQGY